MAFIFEFSTSNISENVFMLGPKIFLTIKNNYLGITILIENGLEIGLGNKAIRRIHSNDFQADNYDRLNCRRMDGCNARSVEFMQDSTLQTLRWMRIIGDTVFSLGTVALALFVIGLKTGWSIDKTKKLY
jgi:hypothetical protein